MRAAVLPAKRRASCDRGSCSERSAPRRGWSPFHGRVPARRLPRRHRRRRAAWAEANRRGGLSTQTPGAWEAPEARPGATGIVRAGVAVSSGRPARLGRAAASILIIICTADSPRAPLCNDRLHMVRSRLLIHPEAAGGAFTPHGADSSRPSAAPRWARLQILVEEPEAETLRAALFLRLKERLQSAVLTTHVCVNNSQAVGGTRGRVRAQRHAGRARRRQAQRHRAALRLEARRRR